MSLDQLNSLVTKVTAFQNFAALEAATAGGYRPTLRGVAYSKAKSQIAHAAAERELADELETRGIRVFRGCGK
jgi:hypothetical protein